MAACRRDGATQASELRRALAEREQRLPSYRLAVAATRGAESSAWEVLFRAPTSMRATVRAPVAVELAFDGARLFKLTAAAKTLEVYRFELPPAKAAFVLARNFAPLFPEGFRTPLLPAQGLAVKAVAHPRGPEAWEASALVAEEGGPPLPFTWLFRAPSGDFLGKRSVVDGRTVEVAVEEEQCDAAARLCVPRVLVEREGGAVTATTRVTAAVLNLDVPQAEFALEAPPGYTTQAHALREPPARR